MISCLSLLYSSIVAFKRVSYYVHFGTLSYSYLFNRQQIYEFPLAFKEVTQGYHGCFVNEEVVVNAVERQWKRV